MKTRMKTYDIIQVEECDNILLAIGTNNQARVHLS